MQIHQQPQTRQVVPGSVLGPQPGAEGGRTRVGCPDQGSVQETSTDPRSSLETGTAPGPGLGFTGAPRSWIRVCVWEPSWDWPGPLGPFGALKALTAVACSPSDHFPLFY